MGKYMIFFSYTRKSIKIKLVESQFNHHRDKEACRIVRCSNSGCLFFVFPYSWHCWRGVFCVISLFEKLFFWILIAANESRKSCSLHEYPLFTCMQSCIPAYLFVFIALNSFKVLKGSGYILKEYRFFP